MASKYDALARHLRKQRGPRHEMSFAQIERLVGTPLPRSSHVWRPWWANSHHTQALNGWMAAGWEVDSVDPTNERVTFRQ